jgi:quercetin dioxygenase-like cupin family protein
MDCRGQPIRRRASPSRVSRAPALAPRHGKRPNLTAHRGKSGDSVFYISKNRPICSIVSVRLMRPTGAIFGKQNADSAAHVLSLLGWSRAKVSFQSALHSFLQEMEFNVPRKLTRLALLSAAIVLAALHSAMNPRTAWATPAVGFTTTTTMSGSFGAIDIFSKPIIPDSRENDRRAKAWLSRQNTTGPSDLYVQSNVWLPGGSTGWHTHPGRSLIIVAAGTVTEYQDSDLDCRPHVYTEGMTFVDPHGDHAHIIRNEGSAVARTIAIQLIPAGVARRIDSADPGNCRF